MKIAIVAAMSLNGKITRGSESSVAAWSSEADKCFLKQMLADYPVSIMGRRTYDVVKPKPVTNQLRIILTRKSSEYSKSNIPDQLKFTDDSPETIIDNLSKRGFSKVLILGGSEIYSLFLDAGLVTDIYITLEPLIFGQGTDLLSEACENISCKLVSSKVVNEQGTMLLHYRTA